MTDSFGGTQAGSSMRRAAFSRPRRRLVVFFGAGSGAGGFVDARHGVRDESSPSAVGSFGR